MLVWVEPSCIFFVQPFQFLLSHKCPILGICGFSLFIRGFFCPQMFIILFITAMNCNEHALSALLFAEKLVVNVSDNIHRSGIGCRDFMGVNIQRRAGFGMT